MCHCQQLLYPGSVSILSVIHFHFVLTVDALLASYINVIVLLLWTWSSFSCSDYETLIADTVVFM